MITPKLSLDELRDTSNITVVDDFDQKVIRNEVAEKKREIALDLLGKAGLLKELEKHSENGSDNLVQE